MAANAGADTEAVEQLIQAIIDRGSEYDVDALDRLYHDALVVVRVGVDGAMRVTDKAQALLFFRTMRESGSPPLSRSARVRVTEVAGDRAHAVVLREAQAEGMPRRLVFSVDCVKEDGAWRVRREVAVAQP